MAASEEYADTMNLNVKELLKEVQLDYSFTTTKTINDVISSIKESIDEIPEDLQVTKDLAPKFIRNIGADKVEFKFKRPKSIQVGGSYSFQCISKPDINVDLLIRLPKEMGLLMAMNFVFLRGAYNESTLTVLGRNQVFNKVREMSVIGGSELFRFPRGYVQASTHSFDLKTGDAIVQYNVYFMHY